MPAANLSIIIKMSGGSLPPNTRAGDVEIYDNGRLVIYETDTDLVERQIDRQQVLDTLQFARQVGFFQLQNVIHDGGNAVNVPDVTISLNDSMGTGTVTMTNYQRLKGEMRRDPFDQVYKKITDLAWESYTNGKPFAQAQPQPEQVAVDKPSFSQVEATKPALELPSLDDLLKSSNLDFGPALTNDQGLPSLPQNPPPPVQPQGQAPKTPSLPAMAPMQSFSGTAAAAPSLPPLSAPMQQNQPGSANNSLPPLQQSRPQAMPPKQPPQQQPPKPQTSQQQQPAPAPKNPLSVPAPKPQQQQQPKPQAPQQQQPKPNPVPQPAPAAPQVKKVEQPTPAPVKPPQEIPVAKPVDPVQESKRPAPSQPPAPKPSPAPQVMSEPTPVVEVPPQNIQPRMEQKPQDRPERTEQRHQDQPPIRQDKNEKPRQQQGRQDTSRRITMKHPPVGWEHTQELIGRLEETLKGKLLCIYVADDHEVSMDDMRYLYSHLRKSGEKKTLYVLPIIPSGQLPVVWRMATLLREFAQELVFVLPDAASVFSTMLSLSGDSILMNPLGYLSPVETRFTHQLLQNNSPVSLSEVLQASQLSQESNSKSKGAVESQQPSLHPLVVTAAQRQLSLIQLLCTNLLKLNPKGPKDDASVSRVVQQMTSSFLSSDYPITLGEVKNLGLNVSETTEETNDLLWELIKHYRYISQPVLALRDDYRSLEQQTALIESVGRRTLYYKEVHEDLRKDQILDSYNRWRELTMQLSISQNGKEHTELQWKELQIIGQFD